MSRLSKARSKLKDVSLMTTDVVEFLVSWGYERLPMVEGRGLIHREKGQSATPPWTLGAEDSQYLTRTCHHRGHFGGWDGDYGGAGFVVYGTSFACVAWGAGRRGLHIESAGDCKDVYVVVVRTTEASHPASEGRGIQSSSSKQLDSSSHLHSRGMSSGHRLLKQGHYEFRSTFSIPPLPPMGRKTNKTTK